jgi:FeoB-associated Cys-rich membrane protein
MNTLEYIALAVIAILALFLIIRMIRRIAKGESACMFCKSCGEEKSSCDVPEESSGKQEDESETKED